MRLTKLSLFHYFCTKIGKFSVGIAWPQILSSTLNLPHVELHAALENSGAMVNFNVTQDTKKS